MDIKISSLNISIKDINHKSIPISFLKYKGKDFKENQLLYQFNLVEELPLLNKKWIIAHKSHQLVVLKKNNLEARYIYDYGQTVQYALFKENINGTITIYFDKKHEELLKEKTILISTLAIEKYLALNKEFILHASCVIHNEQAILFCGPSGIGKSTQAKLWEKELGTPIINEDRMLISQQDNHYVCQGWPFSGSSITNIDGEFPLKAIILLGQSNENTILSQKPIYLFQKTLSQITYNPWNIENTNLALDFTNGLVRNNYIIEYNCNISADAVLKLKNYLDH